MLSNLLPWGLGRGGSLLVSNEIVERFGVITTEDSAAGFPASNLIDPRRKAVWRSDGPPEGPGDVFGFEIDFSDAIFASPGVFGETPVNFAALLFGNFAGRKLAEGASPQAFFEMRVQVKGFVGLDPVVSFDTDWVRPWPAGTANPWQHTFGVSSRYYFPPGAHAVVYFPDPFNVGEDLNIGDAESRSVEISVRYSGTMSGFLHEPYFQFGYFVLGHAIPVHTLAGEVTAGTTTEESRELTSWGSERLVLPGPKFDSKTWEVVMSRKQLTQEIYPLLRERGSSGSVLAINRVPPLYTEEDHAPWETHQSILHGTISEVSEIQEIGRNHKRCRIAFKEL